MGDQVTSGCGRLVYTLIRFLLFLSALFKHCVADLAKRFPEFLIRSSWGRTNRLPLGLESLNVINPICRRGAVSEYCSRFFNNRFFAFQVSQAGCLDLLVQSFLRVLKPGFQGLRDGRSD